MGYKPRFKRGDYKVRCDISGMMVNASECRMQWNGLFVHKDFWSPRHPQDRIMTPKTNQTPSNPRPAGEDQFIGPTDVTAEDL